GGKWSTYRFMAEDILRYCSRHGLLPTLSASRTADFPLLGAQSGPARNLADAPDLSAYGTEAAAVESLSHPGDMPLTDGLTPAMVCFSVRRVFARGVEDCGVR